MVSTAARHDDRVYRDISSEGRFTDVLQVLNSRRFVRAPLPWSPGLESALRGSSCDQMPLRILILWGKGRKVRPDSYERRTSAFLATFAKRIEAVWPAGVRYHVLFADTHAALNGYGVTEVSRYFAAVRSILGEHNTFDTLSSLWHERGVTWRDMQRTLDAIEHSEWSRVDKQLNLVAAASRYGLWGSPERLARLYYVVRRAESQILADHFSGCLFATMEGPERRPVLPDLPVLHIYSWSRGRCAKPWNVVAGADTPCEATRELQLCAV